MTITEASDNTAPSVNSPNDTPKETTKQPPSIQPYTTFTPRGRILIVLMVGFATITSPLTATVYFPLLPTLEGQFNVSSQEIDMTLTIYIIFQAISPAIFGPLSDLVGRRPIYLLTLAIYALANLGMALNKHNYEILLLFRALQSLGASAAFAISYGIVADVCVPSERGRMMRWVSMALNLGTCLSPVMGGLVVYLSGNIMWILWALFIVAILLFLIVGMFLPETARNLVGNRSNQRRIAPWQWNWWDDIRTVRLLDKEKGENGLQSGEAAARVDQGITGWVKKHVVAQLNIRIFAVPLQIIFFPDAFLCLWMHGSFYAVDYILAATVSGIFTHIYRFNTLLTGLSYLPRGIGIIAGGYCNGRVMDYNYRATARKHNRSIDRVAGDDLRVFPVELARSRGSYYLLLISTRTLVAYGWTVHYGKHHSIPLILQFIQGFWGTCFYSIYNTLLIDTFEQNPSSAGASASIMRCAMAAIGVSILQRLLDAAGLGWYFTALGIFSAVCGAMAVWCIRRYGMRSRQKRYMSS